MWALNIFGINAVGICLWLFTTVGSLDYNSIGFLLAFLWLKAAHNWMCQLLMQWLDKADWSNDRCSPVTKALVKETGNTCCPLVFSLSFVFVCICHPAAHLSDGAEWIQGGGHRVGDDLLQRQQAYPGKNTFPLVSHHLVLFFSLNLFSVPLFTPSLSPFPSHLSQ